MKYKILVKEYHDGSKIYIPVKKWNLWPFWSTFWDQCNFRNHSFATLEEAEHFIRVEVSHIRRHTVKQKTTAKTLDYHDLISETPVSFQIRCLLESMDAPGMVHYLREVSDKYFIYVRVPLAYGNKSQRIRQCYTLDSYQRLELIGKPTPVTDSIDE